MLPQFKFKNQKANSNNNEQNHEGLESEKIGFVTPDQYQILLDLLQQFKSSDNASNQIFIIPSNMTTRIGNKFLSSFSYWILDNSVTDHIFHH